MSLIASRSSALLFLCSALFILTAFSQSAFGADIHWLGAKSGNWSDPANWSGGQVPGPNDNVSIDGDGFFNVIIDQDVNIKSLTLEAVTLGVIKVISTGHTITLASTSRIKGEHRLRLNCSTVAGLGRLNNDGILQLRGAQISNPLLNTSLVQVEDSATKNTVLSGGLTNGTHAQVEVFSENGSPVRLKIEGGSNQGKISLEGGGANAAAEVEFSGGADKTFLNGTEGTICTVDGMQGKGVIITDDDTKLLNRGDIDIGAPFEVKNLGGVINRGLIQASAANVTVANVLAAVFENDGGELLIAIGAVMRINGGIYEPKSGEFFGDGIIEFLDATVRDGTFKVGTTDVKFTGDTFFDNDVDIDNQGNIFFIGSAEINAEIVSSDLARIDFDANVGEAADFTFTADIINDGVINFGTEGFTPFSFSEANFNGLEFENNGTLNVEGVAGGSGGRTLNFNDGTLFKNNGEINVGASVSANIIATDSEIDSRNGTVTSTSGQSFTSFASEVDQLLNALPINFGDMDIGVNDQISVSFDRIVGGNLNFPNPNTNLKVKGDLFIDNAVISNTDPLPFEQSTGKVDMFNVTLESDINFDVDIDTRDAHVGVNADVSIGDPNNNSPSPEANPSGPVANFIGENQIAGTVTIKPDALVNVGADFPPNNNLLNSKTSVDGTFKNEGTVNVLGTDGTPAKLNVNGGTFENAGKLQTAEGDSFEVTLDGGAEFLNDGVMGLQQEQPNVAPQNDGLKVASLKVRGNSKFTNNGLARLNQGKVSAAPQSGPLPAGLPALLPTPPEFTSATISINNTGSFVNNGQLQLVIPSSTEIGIRQQAFESIRISSSASFVNATAAALEFVPATAGTLATVFSSLVPGGILLESQATLRNFGRITIKPDLPDTATTVTLNLPQAYLRLLQDSQLHNPGIFEFAALGSTTSVHAPQLTQPSALLRLHENAQLFNTGQISSSIVTSMATIYVDDDAIVSNLGLLSIQSPFTSAQVLVGGDAQFNNVGHLNFSAGSAANVTVLPPNPLAGKTTATLLISDDALFNNQTGASLQFLQSATSALLEISENAELINCGTTAVVGAFGGASLASLHLRNLALFNHKGMLDVSAATLNIMSIGAAAFNLQSSATINLNAATLTSNATSASLPTGFALTGSGTFALADLLISSGLTAPGSSPGVLTIDGSYQLSSSASLQMEIGGLLPGSGHDQLKVNGELTLNGTLDLSLINAFIPTDGAEFVLFEYESVTGAFASLNGLQPANGITLSLSVGATQAVVGAEVADAILLDVDVYFQGYWNGSTHRRTAFMLELRQGPVLATSAVVARSSALRSTGSTTSFAFEGLVDGDYWLVVRHGGHIPLASATPVTLNSGLNAFDFSQAVNVTGGLLWLTDLPGNVKGALSGELNADNSISADDFVQLFTPNFGIVNPGLVPPLD